jgi:hypothetical protein
MTRGGGNAAPRLPLVGVTLAAVAVAAIYLLRLDQAAGLWVDDAWYIVLAEALWNGEGFRLISSAVAPLVATFPPGFPLLLAPVVGVFPAFPANVPALKAVSVAAMLGVGLSTFVFLARYHQVPRALAAAVAMMAVSVPAFVFLATSTVMAEPVFALGQLCLAIAVERSVRERPGTASDVISGLIAGATLLVRAAGVAGVAAAACYLARKRGLRPALIVSIVAATCYAPWGVYAYVNRATPAQRSAHGGSVTNSYRELLAMRYSGQASSGTVTIADLGDRVSSNLLNILGRDVGAMVIPAAYRPPVESGYEVFGMTGYAGTHVSSMGRTRGVVGLSLAVSLAVVLGLLITARRGATVVEWIVAATLAMVVLVPAPTFRYVLPLSPFILFYFLRGLTLLAPGAAARADQPVTPPVRIAAACIAILFAAEHATYIWRAWRGPAPAWLVEHHDARQVTDWLAANGTGFVASNNPGLVYLATRRKGVSMGDMHANWHRWRALGVQHGAAIQWAPKPDNSLPHTLVFETSRTNLWVVELPGDPDRK